jgi:glucosamine--fructose-6-phosphate aminotransferase (isomerizing)
MSRLGVPVASLPMSVATLQQAPLKVHDQLALAFPVGPEPRSRQHDGALREARRTCRRRWSTPPLADACEHQLPLLAGPELSVAATKSYIAMLSLSAQIVAFWQRDAALVTACAPASTRSRKRAARLVGGGGRAFGHRSG